MIDYFLRVLPVWFRAAFARRRLGPLDESRLRLRVWLTDLDANIHMNNSRYLAMMDLGRVDLLGRQGIFRVVVRHKWVPLIGSASIRFRRSLEPLERFELRSRIVGWDAKWWFVEQRFFTRNGQLAAQGVVKGLFRDPSTGEPVDLGRIFELAGTPVERKAIPQWVQTWLDSESLQRESAKAEESAPAQ